MLVTPTGLVMSATLEGHESTGNRLFNAREKLADVLRSSTTKRRSSDLTEFNVEKKHPHPSTDTI